MARGKKEMTCPILESSVSSKILNLNNPSAKTSWVCPPERRRIRNGNLGEEEPEVRRGVRAWACCKVKKSGLDLVERRRGERGESITI